MLVYSKIRSHITKSTSATYLNAIILSILSYCLPLWSLTSQTTLNPVIQLYNRAYKIHANLHLHSHHCNALQESNALHFENYCKLLAMKTYFQIQHNNTAVIIYELLPKHPALRQNRKTRSVTNKENLLPRYRNNYGCLSFFNSNTVTWNRIPLQIRNSPSLKIFKHLYKTYFHESQFCNH